MLTALPQSAQPERVERDRTTERVENGEEQYERVSEAARQRLIDAMDQAVLRAADAGELDELEELESQREAFEENSELPASRAVRRDALAYHRTMERAKDDLVRIYERAIRSYTQERRVDEARAIRTRLAMLELGVTITRAEYEGHTYAVLASPATWADAREVCRSMGGDLVSLEDRSEMIFVAELAEAVDVDRIWVGVSDEEDEGVWEWADGSAAQFTSWHHGEPNGGRQENAVEMLIETKTWNDIPGGRLRAYICEWGDDDPGEDDATD